MALSFISRHLVRNSKEVIEKNIGILHTFVIAEKYTVNNQRRKSTLLSAINKDHLQIGSNNTLSIRKYSKKQYSAKTQEREQNDSDSDSDDEFEHKRNMQKNSERGNTEFWRRKMRTFHKILDVNRDGVISFDDFELLAKRFHDLGHLKETCYAELQNELKHMWVETFGEINQYNLVTAEQFLTDFHHRLNDESMIKRFTRFLPYMFKAVDYDHTGHLNLDQFKLFFRCLGLSEEDAAISFAAIDQNGDGQVSMKEFVHLGRQFFITEDPDKISKIFWGPLIIH